MEKPDSPNGSRLCGTLEDADEDSNELTDELEDCSEEDIIEELEDCSEEEIVEELQDCSEEEIVEELQDCSEEEIVEELEEYSEEEIVEEVEEETSGEYDDKECNGVEDYVDEDQEDGDQVEELSEEEPNEKHQIKEHPCKDKLVREQINEGHLNKEGSLDEIAKEKTCTETTEEEYAGDEISEEEHAKEIHGEEVSEEESCKEPVEEMQDEEELFEEESCEELVEEIQDEEESSEEESCEELVEEMYDVEELSHEEPGDELVNEVQTEDVSVNEDPCTEEKDFKDSSKKRNVESSTEEKSVLTVPQQTSVDDAEENELEKTRSSSSEKKRKTDLRLGFTQKKLKQEMALKPTFNSPSICSESDSNVASKIPDNSTLREGEGSGSSGKRKRSRWDCQPEDSPKAKEVGKKKKTRWASDDTQLKMLGPLQLPDFTKISTGGKKDIQIQKLNKQLVNINAKLLAPEIVDDRAEDERSPSPIPVYNKLGIRTNTRGMRLRRRLIEKKREIISKLVHTSLHYTTSCESKPRKLSKKLYIATKEYPNYNFIGLILGPRGNNQKKMELETGARILLRGKGSAKEGLMPQRNGVPNQIDNDDLHILIEADEKKSLDAAVQMVEKLLVPWQEKNDLKMAQLRELAQLKGKLKESCRTCGAADHTTSLCPLTAPSPGSHVDSTSFLDEVGSGLFSPPIGQSNPHNISSSAKPAMSSLSSSAVQSNKKIDAANVYVGYLPQSLDDAGLAQLFSSFGTIVSVKVIRDLATGLSKGYGFIKYSDPASASKAVEQMNRCQIGDKVLAVRIAGLPPSSTASAGVQTRNNVAPLPTYPDPQKMPVYGPVGVSGQSVHIYTGSSLPVQKNGTFYSYMMPASTPGPGAVASSYHGPLPTYSGPPVMYKSFTIPVGSIPPGAVFPGSMVPYRVHEYPAIYHHGTAPGVPTPGDIFTPADIANFPGNPDKASDCTLSLFSSIISKVAQSPVESAKDHLKPSEKSTTVSFSHKVEPGSFPSVPSAGREAANFFSKVDYIM